jgi:hypothetical protein
MVQYCVLAEKAIHEEFWHNDGVRMNHFAQGIRRCGGLNEQLKTAQMMWVTPQLSIAIIGESLDQKTFRGWTF